MSLIFAPQQGLKDLGADAGDEALLMVRRVLLEAEGKAPKLDVGRQVSENNVGTNMENRKDNINPVHLTKDFSRQKLKSTTWLLMGFNKVQKERD